MALSKVRIGRTVLTGCAALLLAATPSVADTPTPAHLVVVPMAPDPVAPGGTTAVHAFVANEGPGTTAQPFTVTVTLPPAVTAVGPFFPNDCTVDVTMRAVTCVFPAGLPQGRTATALVPAQVPPDQPPGGLRGGLVVLTSAEDANTTSHAAEFTIAVR
ncbi:hypothetical protein ACIGXM_18820 [Kitasatospora sp. NPDC052896]|uniref:hypothetical protein n=1 Tax=Kitasatospora sp. NPDC052896 TaxID=3364061 RepID=UPI0037C705D9